MYRWELDGPAQQEFAGAPGVDPDELLRLAGAADMIKPTSAEAVRRLREMGLRSALLTGDNDRAARSVAAAVGIAEVIAGVLPAGKAAAVKKPQDAGRVVAMAGDGVNDAAALAQADLGLAMGTGTDAAIEASDLTLVRGDLQAVPDAISVTPSIRSRARVTPDLEQLDRGCGVKGRGGAARRADDQVAGHVVGRHRPSRPALGALAAVGKLLNEQARSSERRVLGQHLVGLPQRLRREHRTRPHSDLGDAFREAGIAGQARY